jgi:hypothetical protein
MSTDSAALARERLTPAARRSIIGGVMTLFIDSYDIYLPAPGYFEPVSMSSTTRATLDTLVFTVTCSGARSADPSSATTQTRIGRRRWGSSPGASSR